MKKNLKLRNTLQWRMIHFSTKYPYIYIYIYIYRERERERSNQSTLREMNPEYSLEGLMLKLQYFGHLIQIAGSLEKPLKLQKVEGRRRRGNQRMRWLDGITEVRDMNLGKLGSGEWQGGLACCSLWGCKESDMTGPLNNNHHQMYRYLLYQWHDIIILKH